MSWSRHVQKFYQKEDNLHFCTSKETLQRCLEEDVLVWDISNKTFDHQALFREIREDKLSLNILVISQDPTHEEGRYYISQGAKGYGNAFMDKTLFKQATKLIQEGSIWLYPEFMQYLIKEHITPTQSENPRLNSLSKKEREVADFVAKGMSNKDVAEALAITTTTVKTHLSHIYNKTNTNSRLSLALLYK